MNKFGKILSTLLVVIISAVALASCASKGYTNNDFYEEFSSKGATNIEKDHIFEMITADDVEAKRNNNENFIVYLGTPSIQQDVKTVNAIAYDAKEKGYTGSIYFINLDLYSKLSEKKDLNAKLDIKYDSDAGVICVCYVEDSSKKSKVEFTTTNLSGAYEEMFTINGNKLDAHALAAFTFAFNDHFAKAE